MKHLKKDKQQQLQLRVATAGNETVPGGIGLYQTQFYKFYCGTDPLNLIQQNSFKPHFRSISETCRFVPIQTSIDGMWCGNPTPKVIIYLKKRLTRPLGPEAMNFIKFRTSSIAITYCCSSKTSAAVFTRGIAVLSFENPHREMKHLEIQ